MKIGISNRHLHLTQETYEKLFKEPLEVAKKLKQMGEFASNQFVTLKTEKGQLEHVRVVGPFRKYNQVEISQSDAYLLGMHPPVRKSGDLSGASDIIVVGPMGEIKLEQACILAERHIHINTKDQEKYQVKDGQIVQVKIPGERSAILDAHIKVSDNGVLEFHIDRDEANALLINNDTEVTMIIEKKENEK